jgi:hypothetical protein
VIECLAALRLHHLGNVVGTGDGSYSRGVSLAKNEATVMSHAKLPNDLAKIVADPRSYADWDNLHEMLKVIRRDHPFARAELNGSIPSGSPPNSTTSRRSRGATTSS